MENQQTSAPESGYVKEQLDTILEMNFRKLDQIDVLGNSLPLDMVTVASLHLLAERENEIEEENANKNRYNKNSFLNDLLEIGFEIDEDLMKKTQNIIDQGFVEIDAEGGYHTRPEALDMVNHINKMFPGMPGMNLIAYVLQTIEEIVSGRKGCADAIEQFDQALISRGKALTFVFLRTEKKTETQKAQDREKRAVEREESRRASEKLKGIYSEKLSNLRDSLQREKDPVVVTRRVIGAGEIQIKEISPHKIKEAKERERLQKEREESERLEHERVELEQKRKELDRLAQEQAERERTERESLEAEKREIEARQKAEHEEIERLRLEKEEAERREREMERDRIEQERIITERKIREQSIEEQIAAFEQQQTNVCPLCHQGKIVKETTESNREYYRCDNKICKFISWDKPHSFACPQCQNPYLLEFRKQDGSLGLKCPLATCSYVQGDLSKPAVQTSVSPSPNSLEQPKKKRLVRRRR
ncbi:MAG: hypothetical protein WC799_11110 [Desulfobacteraceae bacterium]|jgi:ssDNA-binding Zn-finger/Zn-ribbon topoisomerase 1